MPHIKIYTDGAARGNPGPGGYGVVMISGNHRKEISEGFRMTTNNRMELLSVIVGLEALKKEGMDVTIYSDSKYVVDAIEKSWIKTWVKIGFKGKKIRTYGSIFYRFIPNITSNSYGLKAMQIIKKMKDAMCWPLKHRKMQIY